MDATVVVAAIGLMTTLLAAWFTTYWQRQGDREGRILDAKVPVYGECSNSLHEYTRATYNRVKARLESLPDPEREPLRQDAYRCNARAKSAIGQVMIISGNTSLREHLEEARRAVGDLKDAVDAADLKQRRETVNKRLDDALDLARSDLAR